MSICLEAGAGVITLQTGQHTKQDRLGAFNVLVHPKQTITTLALMLLLVFNLEDIRPFSEVKLDGKSDFRSILTLLASFSWVLGTMSIETDRSNLLDGGYLSNDEFVSYLYFSYELEFSFSLFFGMYLLFLSSSDNEKEFGPDRRRSSNVFLFNTCRLRGSKTLEWPKAFLHRVS